MDRGRRRRRRGDRLRLERGAAGAAESERHRSGVGELAGRRRGGARRRVRPHQIDHRRERKHVALRRSAHRRMEVERHLLAAQRDGPALRADEQRQRSDGVHHRPAGARIHSDGDRPAQQIHARFHAQHRPDVHGGRIHGAHDRRELLQRRAGNVHEQRRLPVRSAADHGLDLQARRVLLRQRVGA